MGSLSLWHWLIVGALALVLFGGKGKISDLMGDVAKGIKSFKKGMAEEDGDVKPAPEQSRTIDHAPAAPVQSTPAAAAQPAPTSANEPAKVG
ncbi:twin-arginine translocase TatA/TatE family subunit [Roseiarcaceae bacterium H3SJ34-1]|uniref:twin-arginine translocase TatA/TatE family subunit n=1 Tax=Terripilifer ovatus TaxID=3032367 RepID=UPI003AB98669|nr:twin-arginine translocase TatA/TatE family subunit [Roseiarcaceae bacterium H3SJ34-1]